ncbi:hypothetical protein [Brucella pituitosa]|uniref:Uncharacterized protein n=1 Tax=Brucella pituitosa TaxID=571256 RepID=A0A643F5B6_9HYPH|nr:hypothetical protein [Brucella pituitosa]KAB0573416.1 hypothetical protein F7Q93_02680 [Brucella pituitosa]
MTIPDEAVQAAINAWFEETREYVKSVEPLPEQARRMRLALTAAYPLMSGIPSSHRLIPQCPTDTMLETMAFNLSSEFGFDFTLENKEFALAVYKQAWELGIKLPAAPFLQGVKVDAQGIYDYVQGYEWRGDNGDYTPNDADREMLEDAIVGYLSAIEPSPSPRAQALEALDYVDRMFRLDLSKYIDWDGDDFNQAIFDTYQRVKFALSQDTSSERAQALEEAAQWHESEAEAYDAEEGGPDVTGRMLAQEHRVSAIAIRSLVAKGGSDA